jgi:hypothetical protein
MAGSDEEASRFYREILKCQKSPAYFLDTYVKIFDAPIRDWVPFRLWDAQVDTLQEIDEHHLICILKARQLGLTWLVLGYALWQALFHPAATILLFSRRDDEAVDMLKTRLRGMYDHLPNWLKVNYCPVDNDHEWHLSNGSRFLALPTTGGDSYTASLAIVDEADLVPDLDHLMGAVKPTIDAGGRMILLSRPDKGKPQSPFKRIYKAGKEAGSQWKSIFLPWNSRPDRDASWHELQKADIVQRTASLDGLHEQYPATDAEALAPRSLDKRIAPAWLLQCYQERPSLTQLPRSAPAIPGLEVYALPVPGHVYVVGADPAEGNPTSDDSSLTVLDRDTGQEVAALSGKFQPSTLAAHADAIGCWYNYAGIMVERNNHGHAVLLWLGDYSRLIRFYGHDAKVGWLSSSKGKALLYDDAADAFRNRETTLHSFATFTQLASIEGSTLRAPEGERDDRADSYALACAAVKKHPPEEPGDLPFIIAPGRQDPFWRPPRMWS